MDSLKTRCSAASSFESWAMRWAVTRSFFSRTASPAHVIRTLQADDGGQSTCLLGEVFAGSKRKRGGLHDDCFAQTHEAQT